MEQAKSTNGFACFYVAPGPFGAENMGGPDTFNNINSYPNAELCNTKEGRSILKEPAAEGKRELKADAVFMITPQIRQKKKLRKETDYILIRQKYCISNKQKKLRPCSLQAVTAYAGVKIF